MNSHFSTRFRATALATLLGTFCVSCRESPTSSNGIVRVTVEGQDFRLFNQTDAPVGYFAIMTDVLPFTEFVLCSNPSPQCLRLPGNGSAAVSFKDVCCNYDGKKEVSFFIWTVVRRDDGTFELSMLPGIRFTP
jgi:hypothetical protein